MNHPTKDSKKLNNFKMKKWIKKTVSVPLGKEDYTIALMDKIGFKEEDRKATGGQMSEERLQITFGGYDIDYNENGYIKVESGNNPDYGYFYSLRVPYGYYTSKLENFKDFHDKANIHNFEVSSFDDGLSTGSISPVDEEQEDKSLYETQFYLQGLINHIRQAVNTKGLILDKPFQKAFNDAIYIIHKYSKPIDVQRIVQSKEKTVVPEDELWDEVLLIASQSHAMERKKELKSKFSITRK